MKKIFLSIILTAGLIFQSAAVFAEDGESVSFNESQAEANLPLNDQQKVQLEFEKKYLDSVFSLADKFFGSTEGFNDFGEIYIENENNNPYLVIAVANYGENVNAFIEEMKQILPSDLLVIKEVSYSKSDLLNIQSDILKEIEAGTIAIPGDVSTVPSVKDQKVIIRVPNYNSLQKSIMDLTNVKYNDLLKFEEGTENFTTKARDDAFTEMGGGIAIPGCTTTGIATKDTREFLITAGHCLDSIGSSVTQGGTVVGKEHLSNYKTGGIDVGLILLTNTNKKYGNKYYYNPVANAEYDQKYTTTGAALNGQLICKSGKMTNVTCGTVTEQDGSVYYKGDNVTVYSIITVYKSDGDFCIPGDSGSIVFNAYSTNRIIGIVSGTSTTDTVATYGYVSKIVPALAAAGSVSLYTSDTVKTVNQNN